MFSNKYDKFTQQNKNEIDLKKVKLKSAIKLGLKVRQCDIIGFNENVTLFY